MARHVACLFILFVQNRYPLRQRDGEVRGHLSTAVERVYSHLDVDYQTRPVSHTGGQWRGQLPQSR